MNQLNIDEIIRALKSVCSPNKSFVALHEPSFIGNEWDYVKECIDTAWVSSAGKFVTKFESQLADFTGAGKAVAVVNGTSALHIALKLAGVGENDEVLVPALTFVATANAVSYLQAMPHFLDSERRTLGVDADKLSKYLCSIAKSSSGDCVNIATGRRIKALVAVHTFGHPVDLEPLVDVCKYYNISLIEDAAEAIGTLYKGTHVGNFGKIAILSFNGNKTITTGGGGAILTNDHELGDAAKHLTSTAKIPHKWEYRHDFVGYNYRMPNVNAAIGCAQMEQLNRLLEQKRCLADNYANALKNVFGVSFFREPEFAKSNYWLNALLLDDVFSERRDELLERTNNEGIMTRPAWTLMNDLTMFKDCPAMDLSCAVDIARRLINIPSSPFLAEK